MIFPTLLGKRFGYVNLNELYRDWLRCQVFKKRVRKSDMLDAHKCRRMVEDFHHSHGLEWSYGGWLEDRSLVWRGSYLDKHKHYTHLGLDCNAPPGTPVACDHYGVVMKVDNDHPLPGGWGTRVMIMLDRIPIVLIYAHLDPNIKLKVEDVVKPSEPFAYVGNSLTNGQWYPHVHVQAMSNERYWYYDSRPEELDGYGRGGGAVEGYAREFPDPLNYIRLCD